MKKKILIIDDYLPILNSLQMILEMHNYDVETTQNSAYLLENDVKLPDIILTDYHIPGISCGTMIKQLKNHEKFKHISIILMSGGIDIESVSSLLGVNDFIAKPVDLDALLNKIERCMAQF